VKITTEVAGKTFAVAPPFDGADHAVLVGADACPSCGARGPVKLAGRNKRVEGHDTYAADGEFLCCGASSGTIRAVVSTLFGLEEDEAVLNGRCRVY
jgi:hypothetical protein